MIKKKEKGITLIALVVTIVVLLILAGVSISMLAGENGVITQAKKAKEETEIAEEKEAVQVAYTGAVGEKLDADKVKASDVQKQLDLNGTEATASGNIKVKFTKSGRIYKLKGSKVDGPYDDTEMGMTLLEMYKQAQADGCTLTHETCDNTEHLHIGDYLNYVPEEGKTVSVEEAETGMWTTQTYNVDTSVTWRVLGLNDDETEVQIISGSPIRKTGSTEDDVYLELYGAKGYVYAEQTLNKISEIYKNEYATEARSIKIEDINKALGIVKEGNTVYLENDSTKTNIDYCENLGSTYTYKDGDDTPKSYLELETISAGHIETGTAYYYDYEDDSIIDSDSTLWKMLFDGTTDSKDCAKAYWLASPAVYAVSSCAYFRLGLVCVGNAGFGYCDLFHSIGYGNVSISGFAVRPVVSLKSNVTEDEIQITTGNEVDWGTRTVIPV